MKTITLTFNEALVLIAEGMTMNNVKTLANKLRNADLPQPAVYPSVAAYEKTRKDNEDLSKECARHYENLEKAEAQSKTWEQSYHDAMVNLDKAKQTESTLRQQIQDLKNEAAQDDESLKYFRKWVAELRVALGHSEGVMTAEVFSDVVNNIKEHKETISKLLKTEKNLEKANNVIGAVKLLCDHRGYDMQLHDIKNNVENYYRGN